jgi:hypothetical protein
MTGLLYQVTCFMNLDGKTDFPSLDTSTSAARYKGGYVNPLARFMPC